MFGWDLIYRASEHDLKKKEDVMMLLVHFTLIKNRYRCIGLGDDKVLNKSEISSELLPSEWNSSKNYSLRYVRDNEIYIFRGVPVGENMVFNLLKGSNLAVTNTAFNVENSVEALKGPLVSLVPASEEVVKKIQRELIDPLIAPVNKEGTTQTSTSPTSGQSVSGRSQPDSTPPSTGLPPGSSPQVNPFWTDPERDPQRVGRQDLDPFGQGGGMIFNPFDPRGGNPDPGAGVPGGLPRGSVPPGARFDPFAPPGAGRGPRHPPDPDTNS